MGTHQSNSKSFVLNCPQNETAVLKGSASVGADSSVLRVKRNKFCVKMLVVVLVVVLTLTLLGPQSRFGDKLLIIRVLCPHEWECGAKGVN